MRNFSGRSLLFTSIAATLALTSGCRTSSPPSNSTVKIVNGVAPKAGSQATLSTIALATKNDDDEYRPFCSATLVSPTLAITAAHCVESGQGVNIFAVFAQNTDDPNGTDSKIIASKIHPLYSKTSTNFDIAWVRLKKPAPPRYVPAEMLRSNEALKPNIDVTIAGYGKQSTTCDTDSEGCIGVLLEAKIKLQQYLNSSRFFSLMLVNDADTGHSACNGDSGGPAFVDINGKSLLAGVLHGTDAFASGHMTTDAKKSCEFGWVLYTFAGDYLDWITSTSGEKLAFSDAINHAQTKTPVAPVLDKSDRGSSLQALLEVNNIADPVWKTTGSLLSKVIADKKLSIEEAHKLYFNFAATASLLLEYKTLAFDSLIQNGNEIADLRPIAKLLNLETLSFTGQAVTDTKPLGQLKKLKSLHLGNNHATASIPWDFSFLAELPLLEELDLTRNPDNLKLDTVPWESLSHLKSLTLSSNKDTLDLTKVKWSALTSLKSLTITDSSITDIAPLKDIPHLEVLYFPYNQVTDLSPLKNSLSLTELVIVGNKVMDLSPVLSLPALKTISAGSNPIANKMCPPTIDCKF
ncbi:MAG: trypsin-like serine protease [Chitinophagaceae bacterium]|nr:trypsin-like serine protease [Oligoflexus sp.]